MSNMIQLRGILMPGDFMLNPIGTVLSNIDKMQNLARIVSDNHLAADVFKIFEKCC